jgi:hypothetical protein
LQWTTTIVTDDNVDVTGQDDNDDDNDDDAGDDASYTTSNWVGNRNRNNRNRDNRIDGNNACASTKATTLAERPLLCQGAG